MKGKPTKHIANLVVAACISRGLFAVCLSMLLLSRGKHVGIDRVPTASLDLAFGCRVLRCDMM